MKQGNGNLQEESMHNKALFNVQWTFLVLLLSIFVNSSCSSPSSHKKSELPESHWTPTSPLALKESSIRIEYILGKDRYRFYAMAQDHSITAKSVRDQQILKLGTIDPKRYLTYLQKVTEYIDHSKHSAIDIP